MPRARGLSGPTMVKSMALSRAKESSAGKSSAPILTHWSGRPFFARRSMAIPALPGVHQRLVACGDCANFQASACSRPPEPISRGCMEEFKQETATAQKQFAFCVAVKWPGGKRRGQKFRGKEMGKGALRQN